MLQAGKKVTQIGDRLTKINTDYLYHAICNPKPELEASIRQLRLVRTIDQKQYSILKKSLPYVVCGIFNPPIRKTENFAWADHFIIDIDHIAEKEFTVESLKEKLKTDSRILLMFASPGEDGLKVLFRLSEKCFDSEKYSLFYKLFVRSFAAQYGLDQVVDSRTSDVTRACFFSMDREAYYSPNADSVDMKSFADFENIAEVKELQFAISKEEKKNPVLEDEDSVKEEISADALQQIRERLNPKIKLKRERKIYVPEEIDSIVENVKNVMETYQIETDEVININYGKKFKFHLEYRKAEINVFYGKKGFSVIQSPKNGTDVELNDVTCQIICELLLS